MRRCVGRAASERDSRSWMQIAVVVRSSSKPQRKTNVFSLRYVRANLECVNFNLKPKNTSRNTARTQHDTAPQPARARLTTTCGWSRCGTLDFEASRS